jgi:predicted amidohydrolase
VLREMKKIDSNFLGKKSSIIAVAQIRCIDAVETIKKYIRIAKKKNADIICFPASCIYKKNFLTFDDEIILKIKEECKNNSIWCIVNGDLEKDFNIYNTAILINREGKIVGEYQKINLMGNHKKVLAGKTIKVFKTDFAKIGIAICWDLSSQKLFETMKRKGAQIIFCPASWRYDARAHSPPIYSEQNRKKEFVELKSLMMTRAVENKFFVALCNPAKEKNEKDLVAYSAICSQNKVIKEIRDKEGLIFAKINLAYLNKEN